MASKITLKMLQSMRNTAESELEVLKVSAKDANSKANTAKQKVESLVKQINEYSKGVMIVSEHALLRVAEYRYMVDFNHIESEIRAEIGFNPFTTGNATLPLKGGLRAVIKNNVVVTVKESK